MTSDGKELPRYEERLKRDLSAAEYYGVMSLMHRLVDDAQKLSERVGSLYSPSYAAAILHFVGPQGTLLASLREELATHSPQIQALPTVHPGASEQELLAVFPAGDQSDTATV